MAKFITDTALNRQWRRVLTRGWLPYFTEAATLSGERLEVLIAIGSRETNLDPVYLDRPGDRGNGFGLMQIDKRSYPEFTNSGEWKDARKSILKGAEVLATKRRLLIELAGKPELVKQFKFIVPILNGPELEQAAIASYNCGMWAAYHLSKGRDVDRGTTGSNYSADVLDRAQVFERFLSEHT